MKLNRMVKTIALTSLMAFGATAVYADMSKSQVEGIVKDYLTKNPEVIVQALQGFQKQQMDQARKTMEKTQQSASKFSKDLFHNGTNPSVGNLNGKVTVVEFFDYQCPHCVEMTPVMESLIKSNPDVRVVFKEFPIRGPSSEFAAKAALAAQMQGKYFELHKAIMAAATKALSTDDILKIAATVNGLDIEKLKKDMNSDTVNTQIKDNYKLAQSLELMGTPAFFIAKSTVTDKSPAEAVVFIPGQVDQAQMDMVVKKVEG